MPPPVARWTRVFLLSSLAGVLSGLAAATLELALHYGTDLLVGRFTHLGEAALFEFHWGILLLPALGGLVAGLAKWFFSPNLSGHGTDLLIKAFHHHGGKMALRGPTVNAAAAAAVIATGGSAGPEGPIAALGAAIGAALGRLFALTPRETRVMLVAGCGAGVGAIFQCPLGGALFSASILYRESDYETDALVPALIASVVGYSTYITIWGHNSHLLQHADQLEFNHPLELLPYAILGPLCGLATLLLRHSLTSIESIAEHFPKRRWLLPMIGGLATGGLACLLPQVMDGQYKFIQHAMDGTYAAGLPQHSWAMWALLFAAIAVAKCVATGFTVGSGAPGGVLGPSVFIGGALGACVGALVMAVAPDALTADPENLRRALIPVGMAGVLSASMRVPLASAIMAAEMTGGYGLIAPLMLVCVTAYIVGRRWGLNDEQVPTSVESPAHAGDITIHMLETRHVGELVNRASTFVVKPTDTLAELARRLQPGVQPAFVVVDGEHILGMVAAPEIKNAMSLGELHHLVIAADMMTRDIPHLREDHSLYAALSAMKRSRQVLLPVVCKDRSGRFAGVVSRTDIHAVVREQLEEMSRHLLAEHEGLAGMEQEDDVYRLAAGVTPGSLDRIQRLLVPMSAIGQSLREADVRKNFGFHVIAIEQSDGSIQCPPDADAPLQTSQRLIVVADVE